MSASPNPARLNLEFYRKRAKALLKSARGGDATALARLTAVARPGTGAAALALHDAQFAIAREQGFSSWARFKRFVDMAALSTEEPLVLEFIERAPRAAAGRAHAGRASGAGARRCVRGSRER